MNFKPVITFVLLAASLSGGLLSAPGAAGDSLAARPALANQIQYITSQPQFATALWGIKIISLDSGKTVYEQNADKLLKPASNAKLFTAALALDQLGPDHRIKTSVYAPAQPGKSGVIKGDLIIYGRGDPSLAARFYDGDYAKPIELLVNAIAQAGVKRIRGNLVGDESYFQGPPHGNGWTWDDLQYYYGAEVSALTIQDNVLDLMCHPGPQIGSPCRLTSQPATDYVTFINTTQTTPAGSPRHLEIYRPLGGNLVYVSGQLPIDDPGYADATTVNRPAGLFLALLKNGLKKRGIKVDGQLQLRDALDQSLAPIDYSRFTEVTALQSKPLSEILTQTLKVSQNLYAQLLLLQVAAHTPLTNAANLAQTTEEKGLAAMNDFLNRIGISRAETALEEGSGLSRGALVTPNSIVQLLVFMSRHRHAQLFRDALPLAGVDGSLRHRMKNTPAAGNVRAKTGSLNHVATLSGYVTTAAQEHLAFSILLNNYFAPGWDHSARDELDAIAVALAHLKERSEPAPAR